MDRRKPSYRKQPESNSKSPTNAKKKCDHKFAGEPLRKGYVLVVTLMLLTVVTSFAIGLHAMTRDDGLIASNTRRISTAKYSAQSGIAHFMTLGLLAEDLRLQASGRTSFPVLAEQRIPGTRQYYDVTVSFCCGENGQILEQDKFFVISNGYYKSGGNIKASTTIRALVQTR